MTNNEPFDPVTGEVLVAADGLRVHPSVRNLTDLINMLNDGGFNAMTADALAEFSAKLEQKGIDAGKKVKGKVTITIDIEREHDGVYFMSGGLSFKLPSDNYGRTIAWVTEDNRFTPHRPRQGVLFGSIREVDTATRVREV